MLPNSGFLRSGILRSGKVRGAEDSVISVILNDIDNKLPKVPKKKLSKDEIAAKSHLNVPNEYRPEYIDILYKHQRAISVNKYDLGLATNFKHIIHLKDNSIPETI